MSYEHLSPEQRYTISQCLRRGDKQKDIAGLIGFSQSTVSREIRRNSNPKTGKYSYTYAQEEAEISKKKCINNKAFGKKIREKVFGLIQEDYSPEQVVGVLSKEGGRVPSVETIYRWIRADKKDGGDLWKHCRHRLKHRKRQVSKASCKHIPNRVSIKERPPEADGKRFGDFEMDTIAGPGNKGVILTLTERSTNLVFMRLMKTGKNPKAIANAVCELLAPVKDFVKTITTDNGFEFSKHEIITRKLGVPVFFTDPYSSWQKGAIEHANKLIRQYIPKQTPFSSLSHKLIYHIQQTINYRPRKKLNFFSPEYVFFNHIEYLYALGR